MTRETGIINLLEERGQRSKNFFDGEEWRSSRGALIEINWDVSLWTWGVLGAFKRSAPKMLDHIGVQTSVVPRISLLLCSDEKIRALNYQFRGYDKATNVLSFSSDKIFSRECNETCSKDLGDIAIAFETVKREACQKKIFFGDHLLHLFTHGVLHLLGYDHSDDEMAREMEQMEVFLLGLMGVCNPYASLEIKPQKPETL